ncbi:MAG: ROK family protein [Patescibacteria group bacterium]
MRFVADIGGTNMRVAPIQEGGGGGNAFQNAKILKTPAEYSEGISILKKIISEMAGSEKIEAICIGVPGVLNPSKEIILRSSNLPGWEKKPLAHDLGIPLNTEVFLENDTALVGLGEALYGAGKGEGIVAYITISTGVGGVRIVNGRIDASVSGFEPGHQIILIGEGEEREFETLVSGTAMMKKYKKHPSEIRDDKIWEEWAKLSAVGIGNTILHWSPDIVVLGGSMFKEVGISIPRVEYYLRKTITIFEKLPALKRGELGDFGGLYGASAYLKDK